ncbi:MAG: lysylphosphatidylglycerol synthase domain-containing protein, partial [Candidatus Neomarinimicrobiota bacterium]
MRTKHSRLLKLSAGILIAALAIWLTFRKTDWNELGAVFQTAGWGYALAVIPALAASYLFRTYRWVTLLAP